MRAALLTFGIILRRRRIYSQAMLPPASDPDPSGQQVMSAQSTNVTSRDAGQGNVRLEGEVDGPDYGQPQLPNGVARPSVSSGSRLGWSPCLIPRQLFVAVERLRPFCQRPGPPNRKPMGHLRVRRVIWVTCQQPYGGCSAWEISFDKPRLWRP